MSYPDLISKKEVDRKTIPVVYVEFKAVIREGKTKYKANVLVPEAMVTDTKVDLDSFIAQLVWHKCHPPKEIKE